MDDFFCYVTFYVTFQTVDGIKIGLFYVAFGACYSVLCRRWLYVSCNGSVCACFVLHLMQLSE